LQGSRGNGKVLEKSKQNEAFQLWLAAAKHVARSYEPPLTSILTFSSKEELVIQGLDEVILTSSGAHQTILCKGIRRWKHE
jgi:hypothetical protein